MRVIAGRLKGRRLLCPSGRSVRPTADAAKETIFNLLADRLEGARTIDLFAGVGALGIEALSRGARSAHFVERDAGALKYLTKNLERAGVGEEAAVLRGDVFAWMRRLCARGEVFDIVLAIFT